MARRQDLNRLALVSVVSMGTFISVSLILLMLCARWRQPAYQQCLRRDIDEDSFELADQAKELLVPSNGVRVPMSPRSPRSPPKTPLTNTHSPKPCALRSEP